MKPANINGIAPLIQVFDMPVALAFYRDVFGFEVNTSSGEGDDVDWVLLKLNGAVLMLNTAFEKANRPAFPEAARQKAHSDLTLYFDCDDLDSLYLYLQKCGLDLDPPAVTNYNWRAIHLKDPDGYGLCFHYPL